MKVIIIGGGIGGLATYHSLRTYLPTAIVKVYEAHATSLDATSVIGGGLGIVPNGLRALKAVSPASFAHLYAHGYITTFFTVRNDNGTTLGRLGGQGDRVMMSRASAHQSLLLEVPDGVVEWNKKVSEVQESGSGARVVFEDGHVEECDLVIGADGVRSVCRQALFGKNSYPAIYDGLTAIGGFVPLTSLSSNLQNGLQRDQAGMTFSRNGFFGYSLTVPSSSPLDKQQVMWWSTYEADTPPEREPPLDFLHALLSSKFQGWKSPWGNTFQQIIDSACSSASTHLGPYNKWLVLPRYQTERLSSWTSTEKRIILMGDAAHTMSPDSGQGASQALEDAQMLGLLLGLYSPPEGVADETTISDALGKVCEAYETMRIPRVNRILDMGKRQGDGKRQISWFRSKLRDLFLWLMCHLPVSVLLRINPTHLYDVDLEVKKYLALKKN